LSNIDISIDMNQSNTATPKAIRIYFTIQPPVSSFIIAQCFTKSMGSGLYFEHKNGFFVHKSIKGYACPQWTVMFKVET
jgi:hypothetical protein